MQPGGGLGVHAEGRGVPGGGDPGNCGVGVAKEEKMLPSSRHPEGEGSRAARAAQCGGS